MIGNNIPAAVKPPIAAEKRFGLAFAKFAKLAKLCTAALKNKKRDLNVVAPRPPAPFY